MLGMTVRSVSLECGEISFVEEGSGRTVLLLHGAPLTSFGFVRVIHALRERYRVLAPDLPGFGRSKADPRFPGSLESYARFVEEFCRSLRLSDFVAYVNDSSACIGLPALANLGGEVAGLVVADTVPLPMTGRFQIVKLLLRHVVSSRPMRLLNRRLNLLPWMVSTVAPGLRPFSRRERRLMRSEFDSAEKRDRLLDLFEQMADDEAFLDFAAARAEECFARTPVLLLFGQFDPMRILGAIPRFRTMFPTHTVRIVPFEEHFPILGSGALVGRMVDEWIQGLPNRRQSTDRRF